MDNETNSLLSVLSKLSGIFKANADEKAKNEPQNSTATPQSQQDRQRQNKSAAPIQDKATIPSQSKAATLTQSKSARDATNEFIKNHTTLAQKIRSNASNEFTKSRTNLTQPSK